MLQHVQRFLMAFDNAEWKFLQVTQFPCNLFGRTYRRPDMGHCQLVCACPA